MFIRLARGGLIILFFQHSSSQVEKENNKLIKSDGERLNINLNCRPKC